ncbi:MAG: hypothetical protein JWM47_1061 [Acidimicrobiales bacterium]|nr:hypothetical protein [Acidimicrobiales bacterium]
MPAADDAVTDTPADAGARAATRRWWRALALIVAAGLAVRFGYIFGWANPLKIQGDAIYYHHGANLLADGDGYIQPVAVELTGRRVQAADHPPAYVTYLAVASLAGFRTLLAHQLWSAILSGGTIALVGLTGRRLGGRRVGLVAAALAAFAPMMWSSDAEILAETGAIFASALVVFAAYRCWEQPTRWSAAAVGASIGLAALTRSELLLLAPPVVAAIAWSHRRTPARAVQVAVIASAATVLAVAPWALHNRSRMEDPAVLSDQLDRTMSASWCDATFDGPLLGYKSYRCILDAEQGATDHQVAKANQARVWRAYRDDHLAEVPKVAAARAGRIWWLFRPHQQLRFEQAFGLPYPLAVAIMVVTWLSLPLAGLGLWRLRGRAVPILPLLASILVATATAAMTFGQLRYRAPAEPALVLLAAVAIGGFAGHRPTPTPTPLLDEGGADGGEVPGGGAGVAAAGQAEGLLVDQ